MAFDAILGVGREPRYIGGVITNDLTYTGGVPFPQNTTTSTVTTGYAHFLYAIVSVVLNNAIAYGTEVNVILNIGNDQIIKYAIPTGQAGQVVYEVVPINKVVVNPISVTVVDGGIGAGGATNYTWRVVTYHKAV